MSEQTKNDSDYAGKDLTKDYSLNVIRFVLATIAGILVFFVPMQIGGAEKNILFGILVDFFVTTLGTSWLWICTFLIVFNAVSFFIGKYFSKEGTILKNYYKTDSVFQGILYVLGAVYAIMYAFQIGPEAVIGGDTSGVVIKGIALSVGLIIPLGGLFIPLFVSYGGLEFLGTLLEPIMRPVFKIPGRAALDAVTSFVGASSIGAYLTSRIYKENLYTQKEAVIISTSFCVVSVGFAAFCAKTVGLLPIFPKIFIVSFIITFLIAIIMVRIPPISRKPEVYFNGKAQTEAEKQENRSFNAQIFKKGIDRAVQRASQSKGLIKEVGVGFIEGWKLVPKVLTLITAVGVTALMLAMYTPVFEWIGKPMIPYLNLFQIPNATEIAPSTLIGITEMYLPVLLIANQNVSIAAAFFVTVLTLVQIVFFAETAVVILISGIPVSAKELVIIFIERTLIAIPLIAISMHILF